MDNKEYVSKISLKGKCEATVMQNGRCFVIPEMDNAGIWIGDNPRENADYKVESPKERKQGYHPVCFPQAAAQAAAWDDQVAYRVGRAMGHECRKNNMNILLRPGVNIKRSPLCGRNFEYYSEDPVLAGKMGGAFIRGVQEEGTAACLKHYCVNSQEFERMTTNAVVSERALRELYLKPFEIAIREGNPWSLMTSYNKVNGQWVPANKQLMDLLRKEFGFKGAAISDAMAVHTEKVDSHRYGLDFEIGGLGKHTEELMDAINSGKLDESNLDEHILRMLELQQKTGRRGDEGETDYEAEHMTARKMAAEGMVLLKNSGILPLDKENGFDGSAKIAVIGKLAEEPNYMGCGSGHMNGYNVEITLEEVQKAFGEVTYAQAYNLVNYPEIPVEISEEKIAEAAETAREADIVLFFAGLPTGYESEGYDRRDLKLPADMDAALDAVLHTSAKVILINASGSPVDLSSYADRTEAILQVYSCGEAMGGAICDVITGKEEPGGRLPETFPMRLEDTPAFLSFPAYPTVMENVYYGEDIFVGYRWYEKRRIPVMYPFGYGLSYTDFEIGKAVCDKDFYQEGDTITVKVPVKNTGSRKGSTVIQVYAVKKNSSFQAPEKELKGYKKVYLEAGQETQAVISFAVSDLGYYDEKHRQFVREPGGWELFIGTSSAEINEVLEVKLEGNRNARVFDNLTPIEWYKKDIRTAEIVSGSSEEVQKMFENRGGMDALMTAVPVYRMAEGLFGRPASISGAELADVISELNKKK